MKLTNTINFLLLLIVFFLGSCASSKISLHIDPANVDKPAAYVEVAQRYYNYHEYRKAINIYNQLIEKFSPKKNIYEKSLAWAYYEVGFCYLQLKNYEKAEDYFIIVINDYPILAAKTLANQRIIEIQNIKNKKNKN